MTTIDPTTGNIVELPVDQVGSYIVQDPSGILTGSTIPNSVAGMKSMKSDAAQQGYKSTVGRGGYTLGASDQRWVSSRGRGMMRKPLGSIGHTHQQQSQIDLGQQQVQSGLLSLGTRYTPSSSSVFGAGAVSGPSAGNLVAPTSGVSAVAGDSNANNMRLAAAIASGGGNRGRPRGRRPLRGQFPVVPIDMVRQLGIEQQVILQPPAPVAVRNKAVLCRPLSMGRKTQANVIQSDSACQVSLSVKSGGDEVVSSTGRQAAETRDSSSGTGIELVDASTQSDPITISEHDDGDNVSSEQQTSSKLPTLLPIPLPFPIYIPTPVCLYSQPAPFAIPFPLPCPMFLPVPIDLKKQSQIDATSEDPRPDLEEQVDADDVEAPDSDPAPCSQEEAAAPEQPDEDEDGQLIMGQEGDLMIINESTTGSSSSNEGFNPLYQSAKQQDDDRIEPSPHHQQLSDQTPDHHLNAGVSLKRPRESETPVASNITESGAVSGSAPNSKRARRRAGPLHLAGQHRTVVSSDSAYHLKFTYGTNAWRHWVQAKLTSRPELTSQLSIDLTQLDYAQLNSALGQFVREVRKPNNESYVADSIFYLCLGIQEYLNENGYEVNLFDATLFPDFTLALDAILANFQPRISPEGLLICRIEEEHLWEAQQLGEHSPEILLFTMLYFNTKSFGLRSGLVHRRLTWGMFVDSESVEDSPIACQLPTSLLTGSSQRVDHDDDDGSMHLQYFETNRDMPQRCPNRLFRVYSQQCSPTSMNKKSPFYLKPVDDTDHDNFFSSDPLNSTDLQVMLNRIKMVKEIQEAFMNSQNELVGGF